MNINTWYFGAVGEILNSGIREKNERTGMECAALPGITFQTDIEKEGFPLLALRKIGIKSFIAEQIWFLSGSQNINEFLHERTKIWDLFAEPDGLVTAAYGHRWRKWFQVDQLQIAINKLKADPSTRHAVLMMWDPAHDSIVKQKNVPCPVMLTLMIIGGRLHMHLVIRSNDMVLGFPTDVAGFALLQTILAQELNVGVGIYTHSISNAHLYSNHYEAAKLMVDRYVFGDNDIQEVSKKIILKAPKNSFARAEKLDGTLFDELVAQVSAQYNPMPAIPGLIIAV